MITFILKMTLCAALLLLVYFFLLEKEKMHRFKRFYLLFSLVFSITIPLISIELPQIIPFFTDQAAESGTDQQANIQSQVLLATSQASFWSIQNILISVYIIIAGILLSRFIINIIKLSSAIRKGQVISLSSTKLILLEEDIIPHSFMNYIFVNKTEYEKGLIETEVLTHEKTHVEQKHTLDILFVEFLLILFWFNPVLYMYRSKMKLNHEFLADEGVIDRFENVPHYQMMLLSKAARKSHLSFTSDLNYSLTKKRMIMMTKKTASHIIMLKRGLILPLFLAFAFTFCNKKVSDADDAANIKSETAEVTEKIDNTEEEKKLEIKADTAKVERRIKFVPPQIKKDIPPPPPPIKVMVKDVDSEDEKTSTKESDVKVDENDKKIMITVEDIKTDSDEVKEEI